MRRTIALLAAGALIGATLAPGSAPAFQDPPGTAASPAVPDEPEPAERAALAAGVQVAPKGPVAITGDATTAPPGANPYLALVPDPAEVDYASWRTWMAAEGEERARRKSAEDRRARPGAQPTPLEITEREAAGSLGGNDEPGAGERIDTFGTEPGENPRARIRGTLSEIDVVIVPIESNDEDDGSVLLAGDTGIGAGRAAIRTSARIGDGPHGLAGSGSGDFDFYRLRARSGDTVTVDIDTPDGDLDSVVALYNDAGEIVEVNDDSDGDLDSLLTVQVPRDGVYYAVVTSFPVFPSDPTNSASGPGATSEGPYDLTIKTARDDVDVYAVWLEAGDVLGASVQGVARYLTVYDTESREVHGSAQDFSGSYPDDTPLPGGGNAVTDHVARTSGWHYVGVADGVGEYDVTVEAYRPVLDGTSRIQTIFLDFDGARLNTAAFGGPGVRELSPLSAFLPRWGLTDDDADAVIDAVVDRVTDTVVRELADSGLNDRFAVRVLNSRDHSDPFGRANVSRIIVGGTITEAGLPTIGIAESVDPGNFDTEESALVLLDILSADASDDASLNAYLTEDSDRARFVGQALGNLAAHEAGHFFGNWHVDQLNDRPNLMDQGGNFPLMYGVGPDGVGGTDDDIELHFGEDDFNPGEGFTGVEDTLSRLVFVLTR